MSGPNAKKTNVLLSLHPKMKIRDYLYFKEEYGLICIDEKISEILPVADILSCTVSSVISCGVSFWVSQLFVSVIGQIFSTVMCPLSQQHFSLILLTNIGR